MVEGLIKIKDSLKTGIGFGITSSTITTLGLIVGLFAGTESRLAVIGGIVTIAIADAFSDSLAIHISEESKKNKSHDVRESTFSAFLTKLIGASIYLPAVLLLPIEQGVVLNVVMGMGILGAFSYWVAKERGDNPAYTILEHVGIGIVVIVITYFVGQFIGSIIV